VRQKVFELARGNFAQVERNFHQVFSEDLFEKWFPGFYRLEGCDQGTQIHLEGDALLHTGLVFAHASCVAELSDSDCFVLLVAALVHDYCKPQTRRVRDGKVTFYNHAEKAAPLCPFFAKNVGMDASEAERLQWVVLRHMQAHQLPQFGEKKRLAFYQSPHFPVLRALQKADAKATYKNQDGSEHSKVLYDFFIADQQRLLAAS